MFAEKKFSVNPREEELCEDLWTSQSVCTRKTQERIEDLKADKALKSNTDNKFSSSSKEKQKHTHQNIRKNLICPSDNSSYTSICSSCQRPTISASNSVVSCCCNNPLSEKEDCRSCNGNSDSANDCWTNKKLFDLSKFNEFFLQTKNYENFFMNFGLR